MKKNSRALDPAALMSLSDRGVPAHGRDRVGWRLRCVEQRNSCQRVGMVADIPAIGSLQHDDAGIVIDRDNANGYPGEYLANDARMSQGIERDAL